MKKLIIAALAILTAAPALAEDWVLAGEQGTEETWFDVDSLEYDGTTIDVEMATFDKAIDTAVYVSFTANCTTEAFTMHPHTVNIEGEWMVLEGDLLTIMYQHINQNMMQMDKSSISQTVRTMCDAVAAAW